MQNFKEYLKHRDPKVYNEILGTLALGAATAGILAPKATGNAIKYIAKKGVDVGADVAGHALKKGVDIGADAIRGGTELLGRGVIGAASAAGRGIKRMFQKPKDQTASQESV